MDDPADEQSPAEPVEIPPGELSATALRGVVEAFVLREGTDYGEHSYSLAQKVEQVLAGIARGEARIVFDPDTHSVTILPTEQPPARRSR